MHIREPVVRPVAVASLRPTQMTVGMREVIEKRKRWREHKGKKKSEFLGSHMIPVIRGPKDRLYVIDHHHLARALLDEGQRDVSVSVIADLRGLDRFTFWSYLDNRAWCHPYDQNGERRGFDDIPTSMAGLRDDPFRSLAGELRRLGGFSKETVPFSEFLWADFFRTPAEAQGRREGFQQRDGDGLEAGEEQRGELPAGMVRTGDRLIVDRLRTAARSIPAAAAWLAPARAAWAALAPWARPAGHNVASARVCPRISPQPACQPMWSLTVG